MTSAAAPNDSDPKNRLITLQRQLRALDSGNEIHNLTPEVFRSVRLRLLGRQINDQVRTSRDEQVRRGLESLQQCLEEILANLAQRKPFPSPVQSASRTSPPWAQNVQVRPRPRRPAHPRRPTTSPAPALDGDYQDGLPVLWSPEPVLGFRQWDIREMLYGVQQPWPEPEYLAGCLSRRGERFDPQVPHTDESCSRPRCGIYCYKDTARLFDWNDPRAAMRNCAFGLVALRGKVVEHQHGYRGAHATALAVGAVKRGYLVKVEERAQLKQLFASPLPTIAKIIDHLPQQREWLKPGRPSISQVTAFLHQARRHAMDRSPLSPSGAAANGTDPGLG
jgi:hypothetical protein